MIKIIWAQQDDTHWIGRAEGLSYPSEIEYDPQFSAYFVPGCKVSYQTLRAAKIAAAKTAADRDVVI